MIRSHPAVTLTGLHLLLVVAILVPPARAQVPDAFRVTGVEIEAAGPSAEAARSRAMEDGRLIAMRQMLRRLTLPEDHGRLPEVPADRVDAYIQGSQVEQEQIAPTRYRARVTYIFDADRVRDLLRSEGIPFVEVASHPMLVLPVTIADGRAVLWDEPNPWRSAWTRRDADTDLVPLVDPRGNLRDLQAISAEQALSGRIGPLRTIAGQYNAGFVLVAAAESVEGGWRIRLSRFNLLTNQTRELEARRVEGGEEALVAAANSIAQELEARWKRDNLVMSGERHTLLARVPVENYGYWIRLRRNLDTVSLVRETRVLNLSPREARVEIDYVGTIDQLQVALSQSGLVLTEIEGAADRAEQAARAEAERRRRAEREAARRRQEREPRRRRSGLERFFFGADRDESADRARDAERRGDGAGGAADRTDGGAREAIQTPQPSWTLTLGPAGDQTR